MLSELLDEYKESDDEHKVKFVNEFINRLWKSNYTYKIYKKYYTYIVNNDLFQGREDLIDLFNKYSMIEFTFCKSFYDKQMSSFDYIRIHINNMYGYLTDQNVYLPKNYYQLLLTPRHEYFLTINKLKNNESVDCKSIDDTIASSLSEAEKIKETAIDKKLNLSWKDYKKLINTYIERLFNNYMPLHEYESKNGWEMHVNVDGWSEDNYIVKYFCKSLTGYLRNYVRDSKPKEIKKKNCAVCNSQIENTSNKRKYCEKCAKVIKNEQNKKYYHLGK